MDSGTGTIIGVIIGSAIGGVTTWVNIGHANGAARRERKDAVDERRQQRLASAYVELLQMAHNVGYWCEVVRPMMDSDPPMVPPPLPPIEQQARVEALTDAYASEKVRALVKRWRQVVNQIRQADASIGWGIRTPGHDEAVRAWRELELELRPEEKQARDALGDRIAVELGHRPSQ